jgi:hypothetical protein
MTEPIIYSNNWLESEAELITKNNNLEKLPSLKLTQNVITEITIDFFKPFDKWEGLDAKGNSVVKKIIPVFVAGTKMNFWLNVKNPLYNKIIQAGNKGQVVFKILQTGTQANTKYVLVN